MADLKSMIERVALAIHTVLESQYGNEAGMPWADECAETKALCRAEARAAIKIMREPTAEQIDRALHDHPAPPGHAPSKVWLRGFFRAMFNDWALKDG